MNVTLITGDHPRHLYFADQLINTKSHINWIIQKRERKKLVLLLLLISKRTGAAPLAPRRRWRRVDQSAPTQHLGWLLIEVDAKASPSS